MKKKNQHLLDRLFRHQIYMEGVALWLNNAFRKELHKLEARFLVSFARLSRPMNSMTKMELNNFLRLIQTHQNAIYSPYLEDITADLRSFCDADTKVADSIFETDKGDAEASWKSLTNDPIPASGLYLSDQLKNLVNGASLATLALVRRAYANAWTPAQTLQAIVGKPGSFAGGLFARFSNQDMSVVNTLLQHISSSVQADIASKVYEQYEWVSILDDRTTVICWNRNGTIYKYGEGPLPPAHYNCRSKTVPYSGESVSIPSSYYQWIKAQPASFQDDVLGAEKAAQLRSGELSSSDFAKIQTKSPLTIEQFLTKIKFIIGD